MGGLFFWNSLKIKVFPIKIINYKINNLNKYLCQILEWMKMASISEGTK
jgi:hypothetical protein